MKKTHSLPILLAFCIATLLPLRLAAQHAEPARIVSLSPSITHTLQQIGADPIVAGRTSYCPSPLEGNTSEIVGNVLDINLEKLLLLKPDIVFCMAFTKEETRRKIEQLGIRVKNFETPRSFEEICEQTIEIGKLAGMETEAREIVREEKRQVAEIARKAEAFEKKFPSRKAFFQIGDRPVFPVIEGTYMNQYLEMLGLSNIVKDYKGGGISKEYVIEAAPDFMFISRMSGSGETIMREWEKFPLIPAVAKRRVTLIDDNKACCPTPVFFRMTLEAMAAFLESAL